MPSHIDAMASSLAALGLDPELAGACACLIGDTPMTAHHTVWVLDDDGVFLAAIPEQSLFEDGPSRTKGVPVVVVIRGYVDPASEHIALCSGDRTLARLAPANPSQPEAGRFVLDWMVPRDPRDTRQWTDGLLHQLGCQFTGKGEVNPWGYLRSYCGNSGNHHARQNDGVYFEWRVPKLE